MAILCRQTGELDSDHLKIIQLVVEELIRNGNEKLSLVKKGKCDPFLTQLRLARSLASLVDPRDERLFALIKDSVFAYVVDRASMGDLGNYLPTIEKFLETDSKFDDQDLGFLAKMCAASRNMPSWEDSNAAILLSRIEEVIINSSC
jgi:hypothetical protein